MPHFRIEYSANLESRLDMEAFCKDMHVAIMETGLFELGAVRVRAFRADATAVADQMAENAFIDMVFRVGQGRSEAQLKAAGDSIFAMAERSLSKLFVTPHFALSFSIEEINGALSRKKNAMHARLRGK
jgi:5-carboxymethyl-2-hydroxymuconate isomerase